MRGRAAPGSGVCTRRGGGTGRIRADSHHPGCKPPNRVHRRRPGGPLSHHPGCKPPNRVHRRRPQGPLSHHPGCKPPNRVHRCRPRGPLSHHPGCKPPNRVHRRRPQALSATIPGANPHAGCTAPPRPSAAPVPGVNPQRVQSRSTGGAHQARLGRAPSKPLQRRPARGALSPSQGASPRQRCTLPRPRCAQPRRRCAQPREGRRDPREAQLCHPRGGAAQPSIPAKRPPRRAEGPGALDRDGPQQRSPPSHHVQIPSLGAATRPKCGPHTSVMRSAAGTARG